ncbi:MAG TPA: hypothetical protein VJ001_02300 [Rhodocyclaceae bacterium]|nr:hypothetical protein [Rhodocyclaceae bacterium]
MELSSYFRKLGEAYCSDMKDFSYDSEGKYVLQKNLLAMRGSFDGLLTMLDEEPDLVARVFHAAFSFKNAQDGVSLVRTPRKGLPTWQRLGSQLEIADWAQAMVERVLEERGGEVFLATAVGLDFLYRKPDPATAHNSGANDGAEETESTREIDANDDDDGDERDLEEAGQGWLEEQGFDRRDKE